MQLINVNIHGRCIYMTYAQMIDVDDYEEVTIDITERLAIKYSHEL